jgi:hypothetical protein
MAMMNNDINILTDVLEKDQFNVFKESLYNSVNQFKPFDVGLGHKLYYKIIPQDINDILNSKE